MYLAQPVSRWSDHPLVPWLVGIAGLVLAAASARPYAGSWNDGSRLAAVEALADRYTLTIDDSIFCRPAAALAVRGRPPYPPDRPDLLESGTRDKLLIGGHFYSDKPAVISLLMAGLYQEAKWLGLPSAAERPDLFCYILTIATSGVAYVVALLAMHALGRRLRLPGRFHFAWLASFGLATFALTYARYVNNHILLLAVMAVLCLQTARLAGEHSWGRLAVLGTLAGLGYNLDLGSGPLLLAAVFGLVVYCCRNRAAVAVFLLAALPWVAACHAFNYAIGGVWKPMNMVPEYSAWPGCPFTPANMTGYSRHGPLHLAIYALALLFGKQGLLTHNLPLFLTLPALGWLMRGARSAERGEQTALRAPRSALTFTLGWCAASWLLYAVLSNNYGGACCSVRWFVPFLAPAYFLLAIYLREHPERQGDFFILSLWGAVLAGLMWRQGPWTEHMTPWLWPIVGAALTSWLVGRYRAGDAGQTLNVARMRRIDRWLGTPVCFLLTCWRYLFDRRVPDRGEKPRRILFLKLAEQGSTVLAQAALHAAIRRVGRDHVYFLLFAENRPILDLLDLVPPENIVAMETRGLFRTVWGAGKALWRLRRARIDTAIDLEFFARSSAALCYLSGARRRVGYHAFGGEASYRGDLMTHRLSFNPYLHTSQAFQIMVEALDHPADRFPTFDQTPAAAESPGVQLTPDPAEVVRMRELVRRELGRDGQRLILLNANASDLMPLRRWPGARYVELARRLLTRFPEVAIAFTGSPAEAEAVRELVCEVGSPRCISVAGKTTLGQLLVLYGLAEVLVTNDSGPAHFATLTSIDVVVLFGPETPRLFAARSPRTHPLWAGLACSPCINAFNNRNSSCRDNVCMQRLTVDEVFAEVNRVYEGRKAPLRRSA